MDDVIIGDARLMLGDCLERMREIPDGSVDMIAADLPYGTTQCSWDSTISLAQLWEQYWRISKANAAIVLNAQSPYDKILASSNIKNYRYEWIWEKHLATGHLNAKRCPLKAHENVLIFYKRLPTYNPQKTAGHERKRSCPDRSKANDPQYGRQSTKTFYDSTERYPRSVLVIPSDRSKLTFHPTQKPVALAEYMIRTYTNPGAVVLDNCFGSGTTGVACVNTGRRFIGIEKHEPYFDIGRRRIEAAIAATQPARQGGLFDAQDAAE